MVPELHLILCMAQQGWPLRSAVHAVAVQVSAVQAAATGAGLEGGFQR